MGGKFKFKFRKVVYNESFLLYKILEIVFIFNKFCSIYLLLFMIVILKYLIDSCNKVWDCFLFQEDGGIEYFNTIVVQPHLKLVTNQGRGFHVRCRYQTRDKVITNDQAQTAMLQSLPQQVFILIF